MFGSYVEIDCDDITSEDEDRGAVHIVAEEEPFQSIVTFQLAVVAYFSLCTVI